MGPNDKEFSLKTATRRRVHKTYGYDTALSEWLDDSDYISRASTTGKVEEDKENCYVEAEREIFALLHVLLPTVKP